MQGSVSRDGLRERCGCLWPAACCGEVLAARCGVVRRCSTTAQDDQQCDSAVRHTTRPRSTTTQHGDAVQPTHYAIHTIRATHDHAIQPEAMRRKATPRTRPATTKSTHRNGNTSRRDTPHHAIRRPATASASETPESNSPHPACLHCPR